MPNWLQVKSDVNTAGQQNPSNKVALAHGKETRNSCNHGRLGTWKN